MFLSSSHLGELLRNWAMREASSEGRDMSAACVTRAPYLPLVARNNKKKTHRPFD